MARQIVVLLTAALLLAACQNGDGGAAGSALARDPGAPAAQAATGPGPAVGVAPEGVTVTGQGRVTGEPDTLRATVGVQVLRTSVDQAFEDATAAAERVLAALREHGIAEEDIQTREFSVHPQQEHRPDQPPVITGYVVRNLVEVTIRDVDQAGQLLADVAEAGGDDARVEGLRFSLEDNAAQLQAARERAFADARTKAEHYADLAGGELGELRSVTELGSNLPPPIPMEAAAVAEDTAARAAPIMPGEQEIGVQLQATWSLQ